jgi:energy-coupling factor transporter ATP-binding protein EcfA2
MSTGAKKSQFDSSRRNIAEIQEHIQDMHYKVFDHDLNPKAPKPDAVMVFGPSGMGKTESTFQTAKIIAEQTGYELVRLNDPDFVMEPDLEKRAKQMIFVEKTLTSSTYISVSGIPTINKDNDTIHSVPREFSIAAQYPAAIYFLDEVNRMQQPDTLLNLVSEGRHMDTKLAPRSLVLMASNEGAVDGNKFVENLSTAMKTRLTITYARVDVKQWRNDFARPAKIHPVVQTFASMNPHHFEDFKPSKEVTGNTPTMRGLEKISSSLFALEKKYGASIQKPLTRDALNTPRFVRSLESELVGVFGDPKMASDFRTLYGLAFTEVMPNITLILQGKKTPEVENFLKQIESVNDNADPADMMTGGKTRDQILETVLRNMEIANTTAEYLPMMAVKMYVDMENIISDSEKRKEARKTVVANLTQALKYMNGYVFGLASSNIRPAAIAEQERIAKEYATSDKLDVMKRLPNEFSEKFLEHITMQGQVGKDPKIQRILDSMRDASSSLANVQGSLNQS